MLWQPSEQRIERSEIQRFIEHMAAKYSLISADYAGLYEFSIRKNADFWRELLKYFELVVDGEMDPVNTDSGFSSYGWFPNLHLNFAENLLSKGADTQPALVSVLENGQRSSVTYGELKAQVATLQETLASSIGRGDVLACFMPNIPETIVSMLAVTGLGGVFTSTSCDFGVEGVVDRFGQSKPKVLVACTAYQYNGKLFSCVAKIAAIVAAVPSIERVIMVNFLAVNEDISGIANAELWSELVPPGVTRAGKSTAKLTFVRQAFAAPLYIMYSSGTTGKPKCIVHSAGGVLLQHVKELGLHSDHGPTKNLMFFTTCGWMMWNWLVSGLFFGGTITLYEGSPAFPSLKSFLGIIAREKITTFGTSPKYLRALEDSGEFLGDVDVSSLETILSTGAPLLPEQYDFVYQKIKSDVLLASISGGTDIVGCFFLGNPISPVYRGELQCRGLGMDVACFNENAEAVIGKEGELVCRSSFPSRPLYFLDDPDGSIMRDAYFSQFPGVWYHGDFIRITEHGGAMFYGRSDATLNPGGVRIGTSEIYRQTETLPYVEDAVCVGKNNDGDVDVVLFIKMAAGESLSEQRIAEIKTRIKHNTTPRHVPRHVIAVEDIPYTRSGKKIELAVARIINGKAITNKEAIANPDSLAQYENMFAD